MRECRIPRDWSLLALQNVRTGKSHYLVICRCPDANILGTYVNAKSGIIVLEKKLNELVRIVQAISGYITTDRYNCSSSTIYTSCTLPMDR